MPQVFSTRPRALLLLAPLALLAAGCEEETIAKLSVKAAFNPTSLDFAEVTIGDGATRTAALRNMGTAGFTIETAEISAPFSIYGPAGGLVGKAVGPGGSLSVDVSFLPTAIGEVTGKLTVSGGGATAELELHGIGVEQPTANLSIDPTALDFGELEVGMQLSKDVTITNSGLARGIVDHINLESTGTDATTNDEFQPGVATPLAVEPGQSVTVPVIFKPRTEGAHADTMVFTTSGGSPLRVTLNGSGKITRGELACNPSALDFGQVVRGMSAQRQTTCTANGGPVRFVSAAIGAGSDPSFTVTNPPGTSDLNPGDTVTITVTYAPTAAPATHTGTLEAAFSGATSSSAVVTLNGEALAPAAGDITCSPATLAFGQVQRGSSATLQTTCTANGGPARFVGASIRAGSDQWFMLGAVPGAQDLVAGASVTLSVSYAPDGLPATHQGTVDVSYTNDRGASSASVALTGELIPPPPTATAISVILTWNTADTDVDLHLTRPNAIPFSPLGGDAYFANSNPDWGVAGDTTDNPFLDRDDVVGPGPENMNLGATAAGNYRVYAHYYSDHTHGPTTATVQVYVGGNLAGTFMRQLNCNDLWNVGTVNWNGTSGTFMPTNTTSADTHGFCN